MTLMVCEISQRYIIAFGTFVVKQSCIRFLKTQSTIIAWKEGNHLHFLNKVIKSMFFSQLVRDITLRQMWGDCFICFNSLRGNVVYVLIRCVWRCAILVLHKEIALMMALVKLNNTTCREIEYLVTFNMQRINNFFSIFFVLFNKNLKHFIV